MKKILLKNQALLKRQIANDSQISQSSNYVVGESSNIVSVKTEAPSVKEQKEKVCTMTLFLESKSYVLKQQDHKERSSVITPQQLHFPQRFCHQRQQQQQQFQHQLQPQNLEIQEQQQHQQQPQQQHQHQHNVHHQQHHHHQRQEQQHHNHHQHYHLQPQQPQEQSSPQQDQDCHRQQQLMQQHQQLLSEFQFERSNSKTSQKRQRIHHQSFEYVRSPGTMKCIDNNPASFRCYFPSCYCHYSFNKHINPNLRQTYRQSTNSHLRYNRHGTTNNTNANNYSSGSYPYSSIVNISHLTPNTTFYDDYSSMYSGYSKLSSNPTDQRVQRTKFPNEDQKAIDFNIGPIDYSMDSRKSI